MRIGAKAAWIHGRELARDVSLEVENGVIASIVVGDSSEADARVDLLLPGFINAHCHVEYTALAGLLPRGNVAFGDWLDAIVGRKAQLSPAQIDSGIRDGVQQLLAGGCTSIIDSTTLSDVSYLASVPLRHFVLYELLGLSDARAGDRVDESLPKLEPKSGPNASRLLGTGVNPHAPYSVGPALRERLKSLLADRPELLCAWHLAETGDEEELLRECSGSIAEFLQRRGLPFPAEGVPASGRSAATELLNHAGLLERCDLAFHLNCGTDMDYQYFRAPRAVVHCPGTHAFFERTAFPMAAVLGLGANVCLGTDSLASADTLSMLEVLRMAAQEFEFLSGPQLLDMVTRNPARIRGLIGDISAAIGSLDVGHPADFVALSCEVNAMRSVREMLVDRETEICGVYIAGERAS